MRTLALLAAGALLITGAAVAPQPSVAPWPEPIPAEGASARGALAQARGESARARERAAALDREARAATLASERAIVAAAALGARVQQAEAALAAADAELALVRGQRRALDRRLARERAPVARLLAGLQTQVRRPPLLTLLQPGSIEDAVHLRAAIAAVGPRIASRTASLRDALERSRGLEREAVGIAAQRGVLSSELIARRTELAALSAAERLKARRAAGAADREAVRALALGEQARDLTALLRRLETPSPSAPVPADGVVAARSDPAGGDGGPSPYRLPVAGRLVAGDEGSDRGLGLLARPGALVVAPAAGRVAFAGPFRGYGMIVIVEHGDGWASLVTGLARAQVRVGQKLVAGSPLGQASTGSPRIGVELRRNGERVNPLDRLRRSPALVKAPAIQIWK